MTKFLDITVIIPCYQAQNTIIDTLNCIPKELSIICVDDGSTDNTCEILKKWKENSTMNRKIITHKKNLGLGATRNSGISRVQSKWVVFLDADDLITRDWYRELKNSWKVIEASQGWCWNPYLEWNSRTNVKRNRRTDSILNHEDLITKRLPFSASGSLFRRDILEKVDGFDTNRDLEGTEDLDLYMKLYRIGIRPLQWSKTPHTLYRTNYGMTNNLKLHGAKLFQRIKGFHEKGWISNNSLKPANQEIWRQIARTEHKRGEFRDALKSYKKGRLTLSSIFLRLMAKSRVKI